MKTDIFSVGSEELDVDYDLGYINGNYELVVYEYDTAPYEGYGSMFLMNKGKWTYHCLDHCSCYGPTEDFEANKSKEYPSLKELLENQSMELKQKNSAIGAKLKELGYL